MELHDFLQSSVDLCNQLVIARVYICSRQCVHIFHIVSEPLFHKYIVLLMSITISWCFPGVQSSLRLFKPCVGGTKSMHFAKINEHFTSDFFFPIPYGPTEMCHDLSPTTVFQSPTIMMFVSLCQPLQEFLRFYHKILPLCHLHTPMLACTLHCPNTHQFCLQLTNNDLVTTHIL